MSGRPFKIDVFLPLEEGLDLESPDDPGHSFLIDQPSAEATWGANNDTAIRNAMRRMVSNLVEFLRAPETVEANARESWEKLRRGVCQS